MMIRQCTQRESEGSSPIEAVHGPYVEKSSPSSAKWRCTAASVADAYEPRAQRRAVCWGGTVPPLRGQRTAAGITDADEPGPARRRHPLDEIVILIIRGGGAEDRSE